MAQPLSVISINFPFKELKVVQEPTLATSRALFDFDVVVVRPNLLVPSRRPGKSNIESADYRRATDEVRGKTEDLSRLLRQGGLLVVILDQVQQLEFNTGAHSYTGGTVYTVTNYDFLNPHFFECVRNGTGTGTEILEPSDPFSTVLKTSAVEWTAFIVDRPPYPLEDVAFFARNGAGSFIGGRLGADAGHIVFLPNFKELNEEQFFEACREYRYSREGIQPPVWVRQVSLPGESDADSKLSQVEERIREYEQRRQEAMKERDELMAFKKLLYEKGKTQLEPIVRRALDCLKLNTQPGEVIPGTIFEIDGRTTVGSTPGILEVKGSRKQIALDEFSPFVPKILVDLKAKGYPSKGILVGNGLCEGLPQSRLGAKVFSPHVLQAATTNSIALLNSVELYCVICNVLSRDVTDLEQIREAILTSSGFVDLMRFCPTSCFQGAVAGN